MCFDVFRVFCVFCGNTAKHSQNTAKHPQNTTKHPQNTIKHHKTPQNTFASTKQPEFASKPALHRLLASCLEYPPPARARAHTQCTHKHTQVRACAGAAESLHACMQCTHPPGAEPFSPPSHFNAMHVSAAHIISPISTYVYGLHILYRIQY